jgi:MFS family permease
LIYEVALVIFISAPLITGPLISRFGAKPIALITTLLAAIFTATFFYIPNFWLSFTLDMMHVWFAAMAAPAFAVLVLQQLPKYRAKYSR